MAAMIINRPGILGGKFSTENDGSSSREFRSRGASLRSFLVSSWNNVEQSVELFAGGTHDATRGEATLPELERIAVLCAARDEIFPTLVTPRERIPLALSRRGGGGGGPVRPFGKAGCTEDDQRCTRLRRFTIYDRRNDFYLLQGKKQKTIFFPVFPFYFLRKIRAIARSCTWQKFWNNP